MINTKTIGLICIKDKLNIEYVVSKIEYITNKDGSFKYIFTPYYDVIDLLDSSIFQGIPGLNLDLRKEIYVRENIIPTFISERVPSENREDFYGIIESVNLSYMDPIEFLIRTKQHYSGDNLYVKKYEDRTSIVLEDNIKKSNSFGIIKIILDNIAKGNKTSLENGTILNSIEVFNSMKFLYKKTFKEISNKQKQGISIAKETGSYKGRKPIPIDEMLFLEQLEKIKNKETTSLEASKTLGISIDKFYRIKRKTQN